MPHIDLPQSPIANISDTSLPPINGIRLGTAISNQRYIDREDLLLVVFEPNTSIAMVTTTSSIVGAPVIYNRGIITKAQNCNDKTMALLVNAGNANVLTGESGYQSLDTIAKKIAQDLNIDQNNIFFSSTGVIGEPFAPDPIIKALPTTYAELAENNYAKAAQAILTTDTYPKTATTQFQFNGNTYTVNGIAKGSGMIAPNMATMLGFIFTDAPASSETANIALRAVINDTFNAITVDGDTSTSDMVMLFCSGKAENNGYITPNNEEYRNFENAIYDICWQLSDAVVRDGEGASKYVSVSVTGADSRDSAEAAARSIAQSPLVKTAIAGSDPNWGRIAMAIGKSGACVNHDKWSIALCGQTLLNNGIPTTTDLSKLTQSMQDKSISISVDLGCGSSSATIRSCDFTEGYIKINADYRS